MVSTIWEFRLLGGLVLQGGGHTQVGTQTHTRFRTQKTAALLAYLSLFPSRMHPREELAARFWSDNTDDEARRSLRVCLSSLRRQLETPTQTEGELLIADRTHVALRPEAFITDVFRFEEALTKAARLARMQPENREERLSFLEHALTLYSSPLLPGFYEDWVIAERERLHSRFLDALQDAETLLRTLGRTAEAETLVRRFEQSESSDQVAASGVVPSRGDGISGAASVASLPALSEVTPNHVASLPHFFTRFFGRDRDKHALLDLLADPSIRLITLLGPGGIGKTRLSVEALHEWAKPLVWVPLASVLRGDEIADSLRDALNLPAENADDFEQVTAHLRALSAAGTLPLVVLDNFEQVEAESGARFLARLLRSVPSARCLVSSRRRLGVPGEELLAVEPLVLPEPDASDPVDLVKNPSVALFADRARSVTPDFAVTAKNAGSVAQLCRLLDGLPLAIELAAAWASSLTVMQMVQKLSLQGERFSLLESRREADRVPRHRSLWNAIGWSYDLLPEELRRLWRLLSSFHGGFTASMASVVVGDGFSAEGLGRLRERSLVRLMEEAEGEDTEELRYELLESLREFAAECVQQEETPDAQQELRIRHLCALDRIVPAESVTGYGPKTGWFTLRYKRELPNIRKALNDAEAGLLPVPEALEFACRLSRLWRTGYLREGQKYLEALVNRANQQGETIAPELRAKSLMEIGVLYRMCGEPAAAEPPMIAALRLYEAAGHGNGVFSCRQSLGTLALIRGKYGEAEALLTQALDEARALGNAHGIATCLNNLGYVADAQDDFAAMQKFHEQELVARQEIGEESGIALALCGLAVATRGCGNKDRAEQYFHESFRVFHSVSDTYGLLPTFWLYAELLVDTMEWERATVLYGVGAEWNRKLGIVITVGTQSHVDGYLARCRKALGKPGFDAAFQRGAAMEIDAAVRFALCIPSSSL